jgi:flagellum-specific ATP synthase
MEKERLHQFVQQLQTLTLVERSGRVSQVTGLTIESQGPAAAVGELCEMWDLGHCIGKAEVVGFRGPITLLMPLGSIEGLKPGLIVKATGQKLSVPVGPALLGRILDALGRPLDGKAAPTYVAQSPLDRDPPDAMTRQRIHDVMPTGIRTLDAFLTLGRGQRVGIFAGSGVGKSVTMGMIAQRCLAQVNVICLIGERGREVREFIERDLGPEGLVKSVVIVATSDQPALLRLKAAQTATAIAEWFRDQENDVLLMMDSSTRLAMAQREVGLSIGEPPATKGYPPSVFAMLPRLMERSGPAPVGSITALYTVLVEGDDMDDPIADTVRGILDGHIVLSRRLANRGHYPAIDVLQSVSRCRGDILAPEMRDMADELLRSWAVYHRNEDLIQIGAYQKGANPELDLAVQRHETIEKILIQKREEFWDGDIGGLLQAAVQIQGSAFS